MGYLFFPVKCLKWQGGRRKWGGWGRTRSGVVKECTPRFEDAAVEPLEEKSSQGSHSSHFPHPGDPGLALMKCTFLHTMFFSPGICLVLCAFIN